MNDEKNRPLGVAHLIFGLVFTGIAAIWLIGQANDTDIPDLAAAFPAVLIVAGVVGLGASITNQRRARSRLIAQRGDARAAYEAQYPTTVPESPAGDDHVKDES